MNMRHSNCAVSTDPFHLISDLISHYLCSDFTLEQHQILYNCYNVVFLFHSFLVCAEKNHNFIYFDKMVFPLCKMGTPSYLIQRKLFLTQGFSGLKLCQFVIVRVRISWKVELGGEGIGWIMRIRFKSAKKTRGE